MNKLKAWLLACIVVLGMASTLVFAQASTKVRGTITGFDGHVLAVKTREGNDLKISIVGDTGVSSMFALQMSDLKQGSFVGVTANRHGQEQDLYASEVHVFPEALRGMGEGHRDWDLEAGATMTNANIDAIVEGNNGKELALSYKGGKQKIIVPPGTPIVTFVPGDNSLLKAGAQVFLVAQPAADGTLTAQRIQVGKDGLKPPM